MDEHNSRQAFGAGLAQEFGEGLDLFFAQPARRHQGRRRHGGAQADDRDLAADAQVRVGRLALPRTVAGGPRRERGSEQWHGRPHIGVVIPGHEANVVRLAQCLHPERGALELDWHPDIDQISGHRDTRALFRHRNVEARPCRRLCRPKLPGLGERTPDWEIREAHFFRRLALPEGTTRATRAGGWLRS